MGGDSPLARPALCFNDNIVDSFLDHFSVNIKARTVAELISVFEAKVQAFSQCEMIVGSSVESFFKHDLFVKHDQCDKHVSDNAVGPIFECDSVIIMASGASGTAPDLAEFSAGLTEICVDLAKQLIGDAEGAAHEITIRTFNAATEDEAVEVSRTVSRSNFMN